MFCIAHITIRSAFEKQFHFNVTAYCLSLTLAIIWFAIPITLTLSSSLLSSIPIAFLICFVGYLAQDRVDLKRKVKALTEHKDVYTMNEDELYEHCRKCSLDDVECKVAKLIIIDRLKGKEFYEAIGYSERQAKRKRQKILNKLNNKR